jgi:hypothetical protein
MFTDLCINGAAGLALICVIIAAFIENIDTQFLIPLFEFDITPTYFSAIDFNAPVVSHVSTAGVRLQEIGYSGNPLRGLPS